MTTYVGVDLAWGTRNRTGLAFADAAGRLTHSATVRTDGEIADALAVHAPGRVVAALDAPLVVPNATGSRVPEKLLQAEFGRYDAGAHPCNRSRPWMDPPRGWTLAQRFGWDVDPATAPDGDTSVAVEVYPHPAMVALFGLGRVLPYKVKPGRDLASLRDAWRRLVEHLERVCGPTLHLAEHPRWREIRAAVAGAERVSQLRAVEDEVDAILCVHLAWLWGTGDPRMRVLGDVHDGYVVVPGAPTVPPTPRGRANPPVVPVLDTGPARRARMSAHVTAPHHPPEEPRPRDH
ncbi:DUF429 domain-containing protein [Cellulomonas shaoxiangyii]|uniref:DUF429 domain-containing protein n=1 Tax=Cellulomonas shaoxiangyii TaxID=2566013 RepID=UPI00140A00E2|nr:DUF429 domain-containing protein [Cellulomonas shaoxiangyii]